MVIETGFMTRLLCIFLILFAIIKLTGKIRLQPKRSVVILGGGLTGLVNGLLSISGPLSSAVFLTFGLSPVSYIASEATAATAMHIIKVVMYGKLNMMDGRIFFFGLIIGISMMIGNFIALKIIKNINKKLYQKIVAGVMIAVSIWLFIVAK